MGEKHNGKESCLGTLKMFRNFKKMVLGEFLQFDFLKFSKKKGSFCKQQEFAIPKYGETFG